jgi:hypothetical protein
MFNIASLRFVRLPREDFSEGETMEKISAFSDGDLSDIYAYDNAYNNTYIHMCVTTPSGSISRAHEATLASNKVKFIIHAHVYHISNRWSLSKYSG